MLEQDEFFSNEKNLVKHLQALFEKSGYLYLKKIFVHQNLANRNFRELWEEWWESEPPPKVEIDMIFVFEESEKALIPGVEIKYFKTGERKFCEGLQQALSLALFGFDSVVLWHIFAEDMENGEVEGLANPTRELIEGFGLPLVYFATKLIEGNRFEFFAPVELYSSQARDARYFMDWLKNCCLMTPNPMLQREEVEKRRKLLKTLLRIPI